MKRIYLCGPTVYDYSHIGNIRPIIIFDYLIRANLYFGNEVKYIHNITDIDDKIIKKAISLSKPEAEITKKYTKNYLKLFMLLNLIKPTKIPTVTANIEGIIEFIEKLINKKYAYESNGSVYFKISMLKKYGSISGQVLTNLSASKLNNENKNDFHDFVIWKKTKIGRKWNSKWSAGRPGWHTECAYFINKYFNSQQIDIHGGGIDLKFPHNENENAQFFAINKFPITNNWIHIGHLSMKNIKMSKSLGNILQADKFIEEYGSNITKLIFLLTNPTAPLDLTNELINNAKEINKKLQFFYNEKAKPKKIDQFVQYINKFEFSKAMSYLYSIIKEYHKTKNKNKLQSIQGIIIFLNLKFKKRKISNKNQKLINKWKKLVSEKKYTKADEIREILNKEGLF